MRNKIKYSIIGFVFILASMLAVNTSTADRVDIIKSPDTFASDTEIDSNRISEDWVIIIINCPGVLGFC